MLRKILTRPLTDTHVRYAFPIYEASPIATLQRRAVSCTTIAHRFLTHIILRLVEARVLLKPLHSAWDEGRRFNVRHISTLAGPQRGEKKEKLQECHLDKPLV